MIEMMPNWFAVVTSLAVLSALTVPVGADQAGLRKVQAVYLMPMGNGLDQYLANRLTVEGVFQVVTDPSRADAVMTDQLGASFERRLEELFPRETPPPPPEVSAKNASKSEEQKTKDADAELSDRLTRGNQTQLSTFSRGKGNVFLVNIKSRGVVWSLYERTKRIMPDELDRTSVRIVERLKKDLSGKP